MFDGLHYYFSQAKDRIHETIDADVAVYGGTAAGVMAAVQVARAGKRVVLLANDHHVGGMTTGGLSCTDFGRKYVVGGLAREFYRRLGKIYGVEEEWNFEPKAAEAVLEEMLGEANVRVVHYQYLDGVEMAEPRIASIRMQSGLVVKAKAFIDCSYEGDLMALAGVSYHVGREANDVYGEQFNGVQLLHSHQFNEPVSAYVRENDPASGLLPFITHGVAPRGTGDGKIQAYNFRLILTQEPANRIDYPKPSHYEPLWYELLLRHLKAGFKNVFGKYDPIRGQKIDKNNHGGLSTDFIGGNWAYPEADYAAREKIFQEHVRWQLGYFYFICNDPRMPADQRDKARTYGLCRDEFTDAGGWSRQLYVREARRMVSDYVMTEADCRSTRACPDPVGMGSYNMDSHNAQRVCVDGLVKNEGDVQEGLNQPYLISYKSIVPAKGECDNLVVPVCCSASHIAYGSIRMEPVFMILGQSAGVAACAAIDGRTTVQDVPYAPLRKTLDGLGQALARDPEQDAKAYHGNG